MVDKIPIKVVASRETRRARISECIQCPSSKLQILCTECGCYLPTKIALTRSKCPLNKW